MPEIDEFDSWQTGTGFVSDFDAVIRNAYFEFDPEYMNGEKLLLKMDVVSPDPEVGREGNGTDTIRFTCGSAWEPKEKGAIAVHESGKAKPFNNSTGMGVLIDSVCEIPELLKVIKARGLSTEAKVWKGLDVHFSRITKEGDFGEGGTSKYSQIIIDRFNGADGNTATASQDAQAAVPAQSAAEAAGSSEPASGNAAEGKFEAAVKFKLKQYAKTVDDHDSFVMGVLDGTAGVELTPEIENAVMDEAVYLALKG